MKISEYQKEVHRTAVYPEDILYLTPSQIYTSFGMGNESGEVLGVIKKKLRGDFNDELTFKKKLISELGDVCWYLAELCNTFELDLEEVMKENLEKLRDRKERGVLKGSGDDR